MKTVAGFMLAVLFMVGIGWASRQDYRINPRDQSILRLSWRMRGEAIEHCRNRTKEELEELPEHMRTPQVCEGKVSSYRLSMSVDGTSLPESEHRAAGAHADRPIYVFREVRLKPGAYRLKIKFESTVDPHRSQLVFDRDVVLAAGQIAMITTDAEGERLTLR